MGLGMSEKCRIGFERTAVLLMPIYGVSRDAHIWGLTTNLNSNINGYFSNQSPLCHIGHSKLRTILGCTENHSIVMGPTTTSQCDIFSHFCVVLKFLVTAVVGVLWRKGVSN